MAKVKKTAPDRSRSKAKVKLVFTKKAREHIDEGKKRKEKEQERKKTKVALKCSMETGMKKNRTGTKKSQTGTPKMTKRQLKEKHEKKTIEELKKKVLTAELKNRIREKTKKRKTVAVPKKRAKKVTPKRKKKPGHKKRKRDSTTETSSDTYDSEDDSEDTEDSSDDSSSSEDEDKPGSSHKYQKLNLWEPDNMELAVLVGKENRGLPAKQRVGIRAICKVFDVPRSTLDKRIRGVVKGHKHMSGGNHNPRLFKHTQETELVNFILSHADAGFPLTAPEIRELAHEYAMVNRMKKKKNKNDKLSWNWEKKFLQRNTEISIKTPQDLSAYRAACSNKKSVAHWYQNLTKVYKKYNIQSGLSVWNVDETGCINKPKPRKVYGRKQGKTNQIAASERGQTSTAIIMANAIGMKVPPMVIFKGTRIKEAWEEHKQPKALLRMSQKGWITKKLFHEFALHFLQFLKDHGLWDMPHLILLDGHRSHTYNYLFLYEMYKHGIAVLALPPHCSHFIQPLDGPPLAVFKNTWKAELYFFIRKNAGGALTRKQFFLPFNRSFRSITVASVQKGFEKTGIWPYDMTQLKEEVFAASAILCPTTSKTAWWRFHSLVSVDQFCPLVCAYSFLESGTNVGLNRDNSRFKPGHFLWCF